MYAPPLQQTHFPHSIQASHAEDKPIIQHPHSNIAGKKQQAPGSSRTSHHLMMESTWSLITQNPTARLQATHALAPRPAAPTSGSSGSSTWTCVRTESGRTGLVLPRMADMPHATAAMYAHRANAYGHSHATTPAAEARREGATAGCGGGTAAAAAAWPWFCLLAAMLSP